MNSSFHKGFAKKNYNKDKWMVAKEKGDVS